MGPWLCEEHAPGRLHACACDMPNPMSTMACMGIMCRYTLCPSYTCAVRLTPILGQHHTNPNLA